MFYISLLLVILGTVSYDLLEKAIPKKENVYLYLAFTSLLAFRSGWEVGIFNVSSNIAILIILTVTSTVIFKEKITPINIMGIILGVLGLSILRL